MYLALFFLGLLSGLILGTTVTVVWYDDDTVKDLMEGKDGNDKTL